MEVELGFLEENSPQVKLNLFQGALTFELSEISVFLGFKIKIKHSYLYNMDQACSCTLYTVGHNVQFEIRNCNSDFSLKKFSQPYERARRVGQKTESEVSKVNSRFLKNS